jgi:hypothetical protein
MHESLCRIRAALAVILGFGLARGSAQEVCVSACLLPAACILLLADGGGGDSW